MILIIWFLQIVFKYMIYTVMHILQILELLLLAITQPVEV